MSHNIDEAYEFCFLGSYKTKVSSVSSETVRLEMPNSKNWKFHKFVENSKSTVGDTYIWK